jgi:prepilin-type N-terminal cleavage/methylation domain-containing protein/prepilin-type processing-associated H-X9-DG protein
MELNGRGSSGSVRSAAYSPQLGAIRLPLDGHRKLREEPLDFWKEMLMRRSRAFTLVELLVVIAIIGILVALLLPAIQAAREAARRSQCINHLKQLSVAVANHESTHQGFPPGGWVYYWVGDPDAGNDREQPGSWPYALVPFLEDGQLRELGAGLPIAEKVTFTNELIQTPISGFYCPSRRPAIAYPLGGSFRNATISSGTPVAKNDYAGNGGTYRPNSGTGEFSWAPSTTNNPVIAVGLMDRRIGSSWPDNSKCDGVFCFASKLTMKKIVDGTSKTYLFGEKYLNPDHYETGQDYGDNETLFTGLDWDNVRWTADSVPLQDQAGWPDYYSFGSPHASTFNMSMCDGSVQSISYDIDWSTHRQFSSRRDGNVVDASAL